MWGYRENDRLGGKDPYSASKAMAEIGIRCFFESFFQKSKSGVDVRLGIARAGNVIGGGDWALDRIVPDCMRAWSNNTTVSIRKGVSTRPWQHVLEPLGGYLLLASTLGDKESLNGQAFNFGPSSEQNFTVKALVSEMGKFWPGATWKEAEVAANFVESGLLRLNCDKAQDFFEMEAKPSVF